MGENKNKLRTISHKNHGRFKNRKPSVPNFAGCYVKKECNGISPSILDRKIK